MIQLDYLTKEEKNIIGRIVDGYLLSYKNMKEDSNSMFNSPGLWLNSIFDEYKDLESIVSLSNKDGELAVRFNIKKCQDSSRFFQQINLKKAEFISRAIFIEALFKDDLIFFEQDKECEMPKYEEASEEKTKELEKDNRRYYVETIKSKAIFDFVNKYYWARIIPSPNLILYRNHNYKTPEQIRHNTNKIISYSAIVASIFIALSSPWLMTKFSHTTIKQQQIDAIINTIPSVVEEVRINQNQLDSLITTIKHSNKTNTINGKVENAKP